MARSRVKAADGDPYADVVAYYRDRLSRPAVAPWDDKGWSPVTLGPTWQRTNDGHWVLPRRTLGWHVLSFCGVELQYSPGQPWRFTDEQARFLLHWFELRDDGTFRYRDGILQRLKGWGKDPVGACVAATELVGPCRFDGWDRNGDPIAAESPAAWVQTAAVSLEQTKNTMRLLPGLFTDEAKRRYRLQIGKEQVHAMDDLRLLQAVTSSPATLEGARSTFVLLNETHHWLANNDGHEMAAVIGRNATKSADGSARTLRITNAYEPGANSVAEQDREAWEETAAGRYVDTGVLYDSLEAPADSELSPEEAPRIIDGIRGDSVWLPVERIVQAILDRRTPPSQSRRFWYNQVTAAEDAWLAQYEWASCVDATKVIADRDVITLGFDGSRKRSRSVTDATALVGCRVSDGHVFEVAVWDQPSGPAGDDWEVPVTEVDAAVRSTFQRYKVVGFYADPARWESYVASWEAAFGSQLAVKSSQAHPIEWWMSGGRAGLIVRALEKFHSAVLDRELTHDGSFVLTRHVLNARRRVSRSGTQIAKRHPESPDKIDCAVAAVLAYHARLAAVAAGVGERRTTSFVPRRIS